mgnify:CR=1 FL=1
MTISKKGRSEMKKIVIIVLSVVTLLISSSPALALRATTTGGHVACFSESDLDDMVSFAVSNDKASFDAYIRMGKCLVVKKGLDVTVTKSPGIFGTKVEFVFRGIKLWTLREGLTNYR